MNLMKKILFALSAATVMVACNTNPSTVAADQAKANTVDTTGFAQFQAFKQQQAFLAAQAAAPVAAAPAVRTVTRYVPVRSASTSRRTSSSSAPVAMTSESTNAAKARKRGISKAAKGAIIGGVAGAAGGAIINKKNRGVGAVIGGVLGAGAGYGIGRGMDKRDGRY
ncbi:MAG: hypothetical protein JWP27_644 [Flaviaesturariibacter sp.]|nr:hypothetical protein [Flaviaesturariibacter sp.]